MTGYERGITHSTEEGWRRKPSVAIVADREPFNITSIVEHVKAGLVDLSISSILTPSGELDTLMLDIVKKLGYPLDESNQDGTRHFSVYKETLRVGDLEIPVFEYAFPFIHAPYTSEDLQNPYLRQFYCAFLAGTLAAHEPNLVFLSNFKVILDPFFVEIFPEKIVSVHPSKLPLLKGWRSEDRALHGENPEAAGYTFHMVDTDLDGGPSLFAQRVTIDPYDESQAKLLGKGRYEREREERLRLKIIMAESAYTPFVLAMVASDAKRTIVTGADAFAAEARDGFDQTEAYKDSLHKDYEEWVEKHPDEHVSYQQWEQETRKPYQRMLFDVGNGWQTLEKIFGAHELANLKTPYPLRLVTITMRGTKRNLPLRFTKMLTSLEEAGADKGGRVHGEKFIHDSTDGVLRGSLFTTAPIEEVLASHPHRSRETVIVEFPTRVTAPRKPIMEIE